MWSLLSRDINTFLRTHGRPVIKHTYDVWHMVKSVAKDLYKASKLKRCPSLQLWIRSIKNMLWWAFANCKGDAETLKEMVTSIPSHVTGTHKFPNNKSFKACQHKELLDENRKPFLKSTSQSAKKLEMAIKGHNNSRLKDIAMMTEFSHTGVNESINNLHNKYLPKSCFFGHLQAMVRAAVTTIDHNYNVNRKQLKDRDGNWRHNTVNSRDGQNWTAKKVMEPKNTTWRSIIASRVLEAVRTGKEPAVVIPTDDVWKVYGKKTEKPTKSAVVEATAIKRRYQETRESGDK